MVVLKVIGCLYLLSGGWCAFAPSLAASFLGFSFSNSTGLGEFFAVYGGLQVGLGAAMVISSWQPRYVEAALYFSAIFSSALLLFRVLGMLLYGSTPALAGMALLEAVIAIGLWAAWNKSRVGPDTTT
ncbi:hypothetical protein [Alkalimarinus sediminis]|uniref:DUF4345 domain-containing protein n=1 Tax=Alkalimarinus sediminis TaxID=1632866 RepID=A0A9E8KR63_9ALTE|nr:hypothetical protein [Alkalimarinus sediminis]UZW75965.1 hypothetical protein NNL22_05120 [Alkalimarinus sediminis]